MKAYIFKVKPYMIHYSSSIRHKIDVIKLILGISHYLIMAKPESFMNKYDKIGEEEIRLVIYVDKMRRVFLSTENKIHSFHFPFCFYVREDRCFISCDNLKITSAVCSVLEATFMKLSESCTIENILENYWDVASDFKIPKEESILYSRLIVGMLSFEPGYLRYDYDVIRRKEGVHPEYHLDINYSNSASFKIGLIGSFSEDDLINVLDINAHCLYLTKI